MSAPAVTEEVVDLETLSFAGEVVTRAPVRYVRLPHGAGTAALVTLDNGLDHTKPTTFGPQGLRNLARALDEVSARDDVAALCVTGKPYFFSVGADLKAMSAAGGGRPQALAIGRLGHAVFRRLRDARVPTFALLNGATLGGGLELALHCTYRTAASSVSAIALPECSLGLVPGWGGTQLLPALVGPRAAVTVILENPLAQNRMLTATEAARLGVVDAVFEPVDFLETSLEWAARVLTGAEVPVRRDVDRGEAWDAVLASARRTVDARLHGAAPAPYRALDLLALARTAGLDEGAAAEDEALADLAAGPELRAGLYAFDLVQRRAKRPVGAPSADLARPVTKVGVVGAGLMAGQLALLLAQRLEVPVVLTDLDQARVDKGVAEVQAQVDERAAKGRLSAGRAARLKASVTGSTDKAVFADADLVLEAVFEDLDVKRRVLAEVEAVVRPDCVLATNTSSLSVGAMGAGLEHPERLVGLHFFNPVAVLPLLEVVRTAQTDDVTLATAFAVGKQLRKSCVLVADAPAFVVNRLLTRFLGEIHAAVDEGTPLPVAESALLPLGLPMTPFQLLQLVGPAVALHVAETLNTAYPERFAVSTTLRRIVEAGKPGVYTADERGRPVLDPDVVALPSGDRPSTPEELRERALTALTVEIRLLLDDGVVAEAADVDLCLLLGAGWPFHLGGITPYLDRSGIAERVTGRRFAAAPG